MNIFFEHIRLRRSLFMLALILLFLAASASLVLGAQGDPVEPLRLRPQIESQDEMLRFGDVFSNAGELEKTVLTRAPAPGRIVSLDPTWLSLKAVQYKRVWKNPASVKRVTVRRAGHSIDTGALLSLIKEELESGTNRARYEVALANRGQNIFVPLDAQGEPRLVSLDLTAQNGAFSARLVAYDGARPVEVRGRAWRLVSVPAMVRPYLSGEEILPEDVQWIDVREASLRPGTILDPERFAGQAPRRAIRAGKPLRETDLKRLTAIKRGEIITITYRVPGIRLTARARALDEAALGEPLRVVNLQSSRTIDVVVTAPGQASASFGPVVGG